MQLLSTQLYSQYQKQKEVEDLLSKTNDVSLLYEPSPKRYSIGVWVEGEATLEMCETRIVVSHNLPFHDYDWRLTPQAFLQKLERFVTPLRYKFYIEHNRKHDNKVTTDINEYGDGVKLPNTIVTFEQLDFDIGEVASERMKAEGLDFVNQIKSLLKKQRWATEEEGLIFEQFVELYSRAEDLMRMQSPKRDGYSYANRVVDTETPSMLPIPFEEFNKRMDEVIEAMVSIRKDYPYLSMPSIYKYAKKGKGRTLHWETERVLFENSEDDDDSEDSGEFIDEFDDEEGEDDE